MPYFVVSEGHHVASGMLNRYTLQPGITDVKSQVQAMAPFVANNLGKKVTMVYPDFAFGHDHRDYFSEAMAKAGGEILELIPIPPTETSFVKYFPKIPRDTEVLYHVMVGPAVLTFVKELGEFFGGQGPELFGFIDSLEAVDIASPGLELEASGYAGPSDRAKLIEAVEAMTTMDHSVAHPQGPKIFNGKTHQVFGQQYISKVNNGRMDLVHTASIEDTFYEDEVDYTTQSF